MIVELTPQQRDLLLQLVDEAVREIGPEIRHTDSSSYKDDLKDRRQALRALHEVLATGTSDEVASPPSDSASDGLVGTP
ncbi:MAG: hypothetical protein KAY37_02130 [Phycisphaerae bacterium]|nr:hypothetical protein [Phycisphaerae bacterium]